MGIGADMSEPHLELWVSSEVLVKDGRWKLVVAQPKPSLMKASDGLQQGWMNQNGNWEAVKKNYGYKKFTDRANLKPCLFDLDNDPSEREDLSSQHPDLVA